jgi:hypothetical protein
MLMCSEASGGSTRGFDGSGFPRPAKVQPAEDRLDLCGLHWGPKRLRPGAYGCEQGREGDQTVKSYGKKSFSSRAVLLPALLLRILSVC